MWMSLHWSSFRESFSTRKTYSADRGANFGKDAAVASKYNLTAKPQIK